jgi:hypothetical protein
VLNVAANEGDVAWGTRASPCDGEGALRRRLWGASPIWHPVLSGAAGLSGVYRGFAPLVFTK